MLRGRSGRELPRSVPVPAVSATSSESGRQHFHDQPKWCAHIPHAARSGPPSTQWGHSALRPHTQAPPADPAAQRRLRLQCPVGPPRAHASARRPHLGPAGRGGAQPGPGSGGRAPLPAAALCLASVSGKKTEPWCHRAYCLVPKRIIIFLRGTFLVQGHASVPGPQPVFLHSWAVTPPRRGPVLGQMCAELPPGWGRRSPARGCPSTQGRWRSPSTAFTPPACPGPSAKRVVSLQPCGVRPVFCSAEEGPH